MKYMYAQNTIFMREERGHVDENSILEPCTVVLVNLEALLRFSSCRIYTLIAPPSITRWEKTKVDK